MAGVIAGALALILAIVAFVKLSSLNKEIAELRDIKARVEAAETQANQMAAISQTANDAKSYAVSIANGTNSSFAKVSDELTQIKGRLDKVESSRVAAPSRTPTATAGGGTSTAAAHQSGGAVTAGADEYIVKSGDIGSTIFRNTGFTQAQIESVNPGINWSRLRVDQKIVLPKR